MAVGVAGYEVAFASAADGLLGLAKQARAAQSYGLGLWKAADFLKYFRGARCRGMENDSRWHA